MTGDARTSLRELPDDSADLVVGDAFGSRSVPWHLATREFLADVDRVLRPDGLYVANVIDRDPFAFLAAQAATVAAVFGGTGLLAPAGHLEPGRGGNAVLVAGPVDLAAVRVREPGVVLDAAATAAFAAGAPVLTDDRAPVDQLLTPYR